MKKKFTPYALTYALITLALVFTLQTANAQGGGSITFTLVKQPCNTDGILVLHATGVTFPITFNWSYSGGSTSHTVNTPYDTLTNYNGEPVYVYTTPYQAYGQYNGSPPFTFTYSTTPAICPALGTGTVTVTGGTPPYTIQWFDFNNTVVATGSPVALTAGSYNVLITDKAGCVYGTYGNNNIAGSADSTARIVVENVSPVKDTVITTNANCTNGTASVINVSGGITPYTYLWSNGAQTSSIGGLMGGYYSVTVKDAQGCFLNTPYVYVYQTVSIIPHVTQSDPTCLQNDGSGTAFGSGGVSPYTYLWSNGLQSANITGLVAGYYPVTVTDANNCTGDSYIYLTPTTPVTVTYTAKASSCISPTGSATLAITGGTAPYSVSWGTYPAQTGTSATALTYGTYNFNVQDAVGCVRSGTVYIPPVSVVSASAYGSEATCTQSDGAAGILISSGTAPYSYQWSNGRNTAVIHNVPTGSYSCTVTDALNCSVTKYASVNSSSPIYVSLIPTEASCIFSKDGSVTASASGGTAPYSYNWDNGQTTTTISGLAAGQYSIYVQDAAGCVQYARTNVGYNAANNSCYCTLSGRVYVDTNSNCTYDAGEAGVQNVMIHCDGLGYTFTDAAGGYRFIAPTGNYTLSESVQSFYPLASCQNNYIPVSVTAAGGCTVTTDFANVINPLHDVSINVVNYCNLPVVGYDYTQWVIVRNNGTITEPAIQLGYRNDGQLMFTGATPSVFTQQDPLNDPNWYSITGSFPILAPATNQIFNVTYHVPANIPISTALVFHDTVAISAPISNWLSDYSPWDNVNTYKTFTVGSFDPNGKEVTPVGNGPQGYIDNTDSILTYTIHFQNLGNNPAQNILVIDTLDSHLDFSTLRPGYSNHTYTTDMSENGIVKFIFTNINLPDSSYQANASIGMVMYTVKQKPNLPGGTRITSPASVYFDFNAPVQTNTVLNTINTATAVAEVPLPFNFDVYPNPTTGNVRLAFQSNETASCTLRFYNLLGEVVKSEVFQMNNGKNTVNANISSLTPGLYFVQVSDGQFTSSQKVTVIK